MKCLQCDGLKTIAVIQNWGKAREWTEPCPRCDGTGREPQDGEEDVSPNLHQNDGEVTGAKGVEAMTEQEYKSQWYDLWYSDYWWIWYLAKKDMYDQWPFKPSTTPREG